MQLHVPAGPPLVNSGLECYCCCYRCCRCCRSCCAHSAVTLAPHKPHTYTQACMHNTHTHNRNIHHLRTQRRACLTDEQAQVAGSDEVRQPWHVLRAYIVRARRPEHHPVLRPRRQRVRVHNSAVCQAAPQVPSPHAGKECGAVRSERQPRSCAVPGEPRQRTAGRAQAADVLAQGGVELHEAQALADASSARLVAGDREELGFGDEDLGF